MSAIELAAGALIGARYRLERRLGEGGMGVVWAAEDTVAGVRVAIKIMKPTEVPDARRRFLREGRAAAAVRHPGVVRILDVLEIASDGSAGARSTPGGSAESIASHGVPAIAMELLEGESLRDALAREGRLPLPALLDVIAQVIAAVGTAHALGVVHRDLKPENIFLVGGSSPGGERTAKVLDFGIAKLTALDGEAARSTGITTGAVMGTPAYMAPEQVFGESDVDHLADVWAIGLVIYQCASGVLPTQGDNIGQILKNVVARPFEPLEQLADVPRELSELVERMLARERTARPADLREPFEIVARLAGRDAPVAPFGPPAADLATAAESRRLAGLSATEPAFNLRPPARDPSSSIGSRGASAGPTGGSRGSAGGSSEPTSGSTKPASGSSEPTSGSTGPLGGSTGSIGGSDGAAVVSSPRPPFGARWLRPRVLAGALAIVVAGGAALWRWRATSSSEAPPGGTQTASTLVSPLAAPSARLACPIFSASAHGQPAGWLGAAAAAIACERASLLLGGGPGRTEVPAELLGLRPEAESDRADPYSTPDARAHSIEASRARAQAYLDGEVTAGASGFELSLALHRLDASVVAEARGRGRGLYEAVRAAMDALPPGAIPRVRALAPEAAAWWRTGDIDAALAALDLSFAFAHNAGELPDECHRFDAVSPRLGDAGVEGRWICAYILGRPPPAVALGPSDGSPAGIATRIRVEHSTRQAAPPGAVETLRRILDGEPTGRGRSLAGATASCLLGSDDPRAARALAAAAVEADPRNPVGGLCNPWDQLMTLERDRGGAEGAMRAMQAWLPWSSYAWLEPSFASARRTASSLEQLQRARLLSPFDTQIATTLADSLLASGDRAAALGVAGALRAGKLPIHELASDLILTRIEASEARFGAALADARKGLEVSADDAGWVRAQRFEIAWRALELAVLLGRARELADLIVARFLVPDPPLLDSNAALVPFRVPAVCALASAPEPCFVRFRALREQLPGAITQDTEDFMTGAERYARSDPAGAARAWRPLLAGRMTLASVLPGAMADVFDRTGADALAEQLDAEVMTRKGELNGATLGHVRAAHRALRRGDRATALRLADEVIAAWQFADEVPPALADMQKLAAQLRRR